MPVVLAHLWRRRVMVRDEIRSRVQQLLEREGWARRRDRDLEEALAEAQTDVAAGRVSKAYRSARALARDAARPGRAHKKKGTRSKK